MEDFLQWIRSDAAVVLSSYRDEMTLRLLENKKDRHPIIRRPGLDRSPAPC
jgi:hypothetical protein